MVTAAGNNFANAPTRNIVYPARFRRVVAACGVMADGRAYADLGLGLMAGNYGPPQKMETAIAAATPNLPWARIGCAGIIDSDGAGTSSATPQVAAAAIWIARHRAAWEAYSEGWMRVEAVRQALFEGAAPDDPRRLGQGRLRVLDALRQAPAAAATLARQEEDSASFPVLRVLTGLGIQAPSGASHDPRQRMLELEALQLSQTAAIEALLPDGPEAPPSAATARRVAEALAGDPRASDALRTALGNPPARARRGTTPPPRSIRQMQLQHAREPEVPPPPARRLRVFAFDPSAGARIDTVGINEATIELPWEELLPGPIGRSVEVIDIDPASRCCYAPVELDHPHLLSTDGLRPSEANPRFHQQMAYAVAMKTIAHFERALGRVALWAPRVVRDEAGHREEFVRRLRIYPHALRAANAFYSPDKKALLFGYFESPEVNPGDRTASNALPGGQVFSCLSYDIVAHETTHALLDGLHRRFREPTNPDVLAFHEAFADLVALLQHFTMPEALRDQIRRTGGDLGRENMLGQLARQFGEATQGHGALRDAIGSFVQRNGRSEWKPHRPTRADYDRRKEPHALGAVLVAAVFDAFLQVYRQRGEDLVRLATQGTGILPRGDIPNALVNRLAQEAGKTAGHFLNMCIRALDYCPPVDITFGDYLRALITADRDLVPNDRRNYRVALVSAFRDRGIYPQDVRHLSVGSVVWEPPPQPLRNLGAIVPRMSLAWNLTADRRDVHDDARRNGALFHRWLLDPEQVDDAELGILGLARPPQERTVADKPGRFGGIEVHSVRPARRVGPDG